MVSGTRVGPSERTASPRRRARLRHAALWVAAAAVLCLIAPRAVRGQEEPNTPVLGALQSQVEEIRGLTGAKVRVRFLTPDELRAAAVRRAEPNRPPPTAAAVSQTRPEQALLALLGLLPPQVDLEAARNDLVRQSVVGIYDDKTIHVPAGPETYGPHETLTYAHEYTHALQDAQVNLRHFAASYGGSMDKALTVSAVIEGDATLTAALWAQRYGVPEAPPRAPAVLGGEVREGAEGRAAGRFPHVLVEELLFPYREGLHFVLRAHTRGGGFARVDRFLSSPPRSTEHILHPAKYEAFEEPVTMRAADVRRELSPGWKVVASSTLGEFMLRLVLEQSHGADGAAAAAAGWGSDVWQLFEIEGRHSLLLETTWDTGRDASEFWDALGGVLAARFGSDGAGSDDAPDPGPAPAAGEWSERLALASPSGGAAARRRGLDVLVAIAQDPADVAALMAAYDTVTVPRPDVPRPRPLPPELVQELRLPANDLLYEPTVGLLFASVGSGFGPAPPWGNSVVAIDPRTAAIVGVVPVPGEPHKLVRSDDGRYVYASLIGDGVDPGSTFGAVQRIRTASLEPDLLIPLTSPEPGAPALLPLDLAAVPQQPEAVAVVRQVAQSAQRAGVAIYDGGGARPKISDPAQTPDRIGATGDGNVLYGCAADGASFHTLTVDASGVELARRTPGIALECWGGLYVGGGRVRVGTREIDPVTHAVVTGIVGVWTANAAVDWERQRAFAAWRQVLETPYAYISVLDLTQHISWAAFTVPGVAVAGPFASITRWGSDGLAFRTSAEQVFIVRLPPSAFVTAETVGSMPTRTFDTSALLMATLP